jgi:hypothetical protein
MVLPNYHRPHTRLKDWVLGRDGHCCQAPGCHNADRLEVRRVDPAGRFAPENLVTICDTCRPMWDLMGRGSFQASCSRMMACSA